MSAEGMPEGLVDDAPSTATGWTRYGRGAVLAAAVGYGLDGFDLLILSFALGGIISSLGLSDPQAGSLTTVTLLGAVLGGIVFGILSDRYGRVRMLTYSVIFFAVFTGLSALAQGYYDLAAYRFVAGIGIGGEFGIGMTLAAEATSARLRARATSWVGIGFQCGVLAAALVSAPIIAVFGWRGLFVVGVLPAVAAIIIRKQLPESPTFLQRQQDGPVGRQRLRLSYLVADRATVGYTVAMIILTSVQNFGYFGIISWLPTYLAKNVGLDLTSSALWTAVTVLGMMTGIITFGQLADRVGRRPTFRIFQLGAAASVLIYSQLHDPTAILIGGFVMGLFANGMLGGYGALMAELYPTRARATAQNVLFNVGRGIGGFAPFLIALVASANGFGFALALLSSIYVLAFLAMFLIPERKGTELT
ncbi:MFS transporter [Microlunatus soli]|uniref:Predicted arabinose efflux permease, MFS family n=1 Tax=Microlunatus soli TaxID=630515 RepID=A0A1H1ZHH1_9ACTN|nr:MFS transporter [Microlunatus soli]SDT33168.1 Predicted arabinose efflux permease, MFS family [Microlunatus soli]